MQKEDPAWEYYRQNGINPHKIDYLPEEWALLGKIQMLEFMAECNPEKSEQILSIIQKLDESKGIEEMDRVMNEELDKVGSIRSPEEWYNGQSK